jgi:hypothetical protein
MRLASLRQKQQVLRQYFVEDSPQDARNSLLPRLGDKAQILWLVTMGLRVCTI